jgi:predicted nuclease of predicted toxin-antitoxin system
VRFFVDMGLSPRVADWLRRQGRDAVHPREIDMQRAADAEIVAAAIRGGRTILTCDLDFGTILAQHAGAPVSAIVFRLANTSADRVIARLDALLPQVTASLTTGAIVSVDEWRHRVRALPIRE